MKENMEEKMERVLNVLAASLPQQSTREFTPLLRIAAAEMEPPLLLGLLLAVLALGVLAARVLAMPLLTAFCTAPMPGLLAMHRYVLRGNDRMRELEETMAHSYSELLLSRCTLLSAYLLVTLLLLALLLHRTAGESVVRLMLCGAAPSLAMSGGLLFLAGVCRDGEMLARTALVLWAGLYFAAPMVSFNDVLFACSTPTLGAWTLLGGLLEGTGLYVAKRRWKYAG